MEDDVNTFKQKPCANCDTYPSHYIKLESRELESDLFCSVGCHDEYEGN